MALWEDIQPWIDKETGLMQSADFGRDNLPLMSAYLHRELTRLGEGCSILEERVHDFILNHEINVGMWLCPAESRNDFTEDNATGIAYFSTTASQRMIIRWRAYYSCFDIHRPTRIAFNRGFFGRFIGLKAFLKYQAGERLNVLDKFLVWASTWWTIHTTRGASDALKLSLKLDEMKDVCKMSYRLFYKRFNLGDLYADYFGPDHPLSQTIVKQN